MKLPYYSFNNYLREKYNCKVYRIPLVTPLTCPNRDGTKSYKGCIYCSENGSGADFYPENIKKDISKQVEFSMEKFARVRKAKLFYVYFQSYSNTYHKDINFLMSLYKKSLISKKIKGIIISTRPDCINEELINLISKEFNNDYDIWIELGLQSCNNETLKKLNRRHSVEDFILAFDICKKYDIKVAPHIILGLPFETKQEMFETSKFVAKLDIDGIKIHSLYIAKNTILADLYKKNNYNLLKEEEYIELVINTLKILPSKVVIHRLTGETSKENLIAPKWILNKTNIINKIQTIMLKNNIFQGIETL